ncbi:MAG: hypothetical protein IJI36_16990 [Kiritimatiellae bacterium]|nr:hypothetical protein [Kiritimatiellia bacterium]
MKRKNDRLVALLGAVLCVCACLVGCERKESAPPAPAVTNASAKAASRLDDPAYRAQVTNLIAAQRRTYVAREQILARMEQVRERARKALPEGATDEQVKAELESNPRQYPAWRELVAALEQNAEESKRNSAAAQTTIRRRILREVAEQTSAKK